MTMSGLFDVPPGTFRLNVQIPMLSSPGNFWPHLTDFYEPPGASPVSALVCLHGGGGFKDQFARNLYITKTTPATTVTINWPLIAGNNSVFVFPQGQHCSGITGPFNPQGANTVSMNNPQGVPTWSNWFMWSQADDPTFLHDLSSYITSYYGNIKKNLAGHSNGGFMTKRMWYENPSSSPPYLRYISCSGPAASYYISNPTTPVNVAPTFSQIGGVDSILDVSGGPAGPGSHFTNPIWIQNPSQISVADVAFPSNSAYIGDFVHLQTRVTAYNAAHSLPPETVNYSDGVVTNVKIGTQITWTYSGGNNVLQLISNAEHQIRTHEQCTGRRVIDDWINFIRTT